MDRRKKITFESYKELFLNDVKASKYFDYWKEAIKTFELYYGEIGDHSCSYWCKLFDMFING